VVVYGNVTPISWQPTVPQGVIVVFNDTNVPNGWESLSAAEDKFLVGGGDTYTGGDSGGSSAISQSISTGTGGAHTGPAGSANHAAPGYRTVFPSSAEIMPIHITPMKHIILNIRTHC
jgi:hypothetical protein